MKRGRVLVLVSTLAVACAAPLTVAEPREGDAGGEPPPIPSPIVPDAETSVGDDEYFSSIQSEGGLVEADTPDVVDAADAADAADAD